MKTQLIKILLLTLACPFAKTNGFADGPAIANSRPRATSFGSSSELELHIKKPENRIRWINALVPFMLRRAQLTHVPDWIKHFPTPESPIDMSRKFFELVAEKGSQKYESLSHKDRLIYLNACLLYSFETTVEKLRKPGADHTKIKHIFSRQMLTLEQLIVESGKLIYAFSMRRRAVSA